MDQLTALLRHWEQLQSSRRSLTSITITTQVESELEEKFLDALREGKAAPPGVVVKLTADTWQGQTAFHLRVNGVNWMVQTQVDLGEAQGVDVPSRCDFLITPTSGGLPIAVYTDGWDFHRNRLPTDVRQRMALQRSGRYRFWSLCWDDVVGKPNGPADPLPASGLLQGLAPSFTRDPAAFAEQWLPLSRFEPIEPLPDQTGTILPRDLRWVQESNSLQLLMAYLSQPSESNRAGAWEGLAHTFCLGQLGQDMGKGIPVSLQKPIDSLGFGSHLAEWRPEREQGQAGQWLEQAPGFTVLSCIDLGSHVARRHDASFRALHFDPTQALGDQEQQIGWREWLRQGNLFQFLSHMLLSTPGCTGADQTSVVMPSPEPVTLVAAMLEEGPQRPGEEPSPAWSSALAFAERHARTCHPLLVALRPALEEMGVEPPEFGYEVEGKLGEVMAELEMAWPDRQVAVLLEPPEDRASDRTRAGWSDDWVIFQADPPLDQVLAAFRSAIPEPQILVSTP